MANVFEKNAPTCYGLLLMLVAVCLGLACGSSPSSRIPTPPPLPPITPTPYPTRTPLPPLDGAAPLRLSSTTCPLPPLRWSEHIAASGSFTETQRQAAGPIICRVERYSCAFYQLVGNMNPEIRFKGEEEPPYNQEDFLMHPAMLLPLNRLSELVKREWDGEVQLRVTDAYDSLLEHHLWQPDMDKRASLHFEGRAIDLTTWPIDRLRYGRLCVLAHCAGFDWVHHEGTHCHAAIRADSLCNRC